MWKWNKNLGLDRPFFICPGISELPGRTSNFSHTNILSRFCQVVKSNFFCILCFSVLKRWSVKFWSMSSFAAICPGVKSRRLSNFETSCEWAAIVKFQLSWAELRIGGSCQISCGWAANWAAKTWRSCNLHLHFPFYYNTNLRQLQLYEAVKFSAARILKLFKLWKILKSLL